MEALEGEPRSSESKYKASVPTHRGGPEVGPQNTEPMATGTQGQPEHLWEPLPQGRTSFRETPHDVFDSSISSTAK